MRIGIQTWGSAGDIRPFLALAGGLQRAGHNITLAITSVDGKDYTPLAQALNIKLRSVGDKLLEYDTEVYEQLKFELTRKRISLDQLKIILDYFFEPVVEKIYKVSKNLCKENDIVIGHFLVYPLFIAAEKSGIPLLTVTLNHSGIPSRYVTPFGLPRIGSWMNPIWWNLVHFLVNRYFKRSINTFRVHEGLPPVKRILTEAWRSQHMNLIAVSPVFCHHRKDWERYSHVCGFFNVTEGAEVWHTPEKLQEFLKSGPPPVFMTFGSMISVDPHVADITGLLVDAAHLAGCRAIVQSRWEEINHIPEGSDIYRVTDLPHRYLFPYCSAIVHHGGSGTTQTAAQYGCPSVVVEHFGDQSFWGNELKRIGIAGKTLHRKSITAKKLAQELKAVLSSPDMKARAQSIGEVMRKEKGVTKAVELIEEHFQ
ncbi:MAG: glycosyltransferase family 1 protein [Nitrospiraceae bacterium]|nr:MAG: glycosyltransferase family 1 protein [Nitrospiraceae bacterium]